MPDKVYTPEEVADQLKCSVRSVYDLLRVGKLQSFRIGRGWRITDDAIRNYIAAGGTRDNLNKRVKTITYIH